MEGNSKIQDLKNLLLRRERKDTTFESIDKDSSPDVQSNGKIMETPRLFTERIGNVFKRKEKESSG